MSETTMSALDRRAYGPGYSGAIRSDPLVRALQSRGATIEKPDGWWTLRDSSGGPFGTGRPVGPRKSHVMGNTQQAIAPTIRTTTASCTIVLAGAL